jgi:hypothetical protein
MIAVGVLVGLARCRLRVGHCELYLASSLFIVVSPPFTLSGERERESLVNWIWTRIERVRDGRH